MEVDRPLQPISPRARIRPSRRRARRSAMVPVYAIMLMTTLIGFASLAVDWGRVQLVKSELQHAADAAARAAVTQLSSGITATQNAAVSWAGYNNADGTSVVVDATNDVDFLNWNTSTRTYTVLTGAARSGANAIKVTARRTAARGNAVSLMFGKVIGRNTCDANASAIALYSSPAADYGFLGLSAATVKNNTTVLNGYDSGNGAYGGSNITTDGALGSNGTITLGPGTVTVSSGLFMKAASTLTTSGTYSYGTRTNNASNIVWPTPSAGSYATSNNNSSVGLPTTGANADVYSNFTVPPGHYYLDSLDISGGTLTFSGPTVIYMNGPFSMTGGAISVTSGKPSDLAIYFVKATTMTVSTPATLYADIQGPTSTITMSSSMTFYGRIIANTLNLTGGGNYHFDTNLPTVAGASQRSTGGGSSSGVSTVK